MLLFTNICVVQPVSTPPPKPTVLVQFNVILFGPPVAVKLFGGNGLTSSSPGPAAGNASPTSLSLGVTI